ncbi:C-X-C chemokine receptor type 2-like [Esox lucius]|uniref:G-protein coupled receptors family 1 profile domain-containing protein n=1 Tax=Esox lucius TaxID=8010 RepID=A0AAY5KX86_ESOLU|nr:C-X-C chemokine receptor type 2-like [Esox lucius]XP_019910149.2 C-X-C chemokine receptor type 2-like [Esox lucius]XP_019910150.2 C-X-C chemokine receptor type 2-like [Esox lucius]XP_019910151.2 C-X-C chemokine receptor type 2-like [Esox lucius]XP_019910152.2 C-X-C chemokine receptor type 2-like [Esox lucius]XP_019910153.2 C-X-C chemokine receptor type 2-like [Esox lucius]XP_019910154.2 C-X-C chemokine receptor type 2-like [Esox lucius]
MINMTYPNISYQFIIDDFADFYNELNYSDLNTTYELDKSTLTCQAAPVSSFVIMVVCAFYILVFLLAIPGNLLVGLVISSSKQPLSPSDLYLLHLAVADILLALTLPFWATSVTVGWVFGDPMCKLVSIFLEVSFYTSILFLACISVDRYLVIVCAKETSRAARRRLVSWGACVAVWFMGCLLSLPGFFNGAFIPDGEKVTTCSEVYTVGDPENWKLATRGLRHILGFLLPLTIMLGCYGVTLARLLRTRGSFQRQKAMRVIVAVVVAFLLCWTPYHLAVMADTLLQAKLVKDECQERRAVHKALFATQSLALLHSCVNPVLYAFVGEKFRIKLLQMLRKAGVMEPRASVARASRSTSQTSEATSMFM